MITLVNIKSYSHKCMLTFKDDDRFVFQPANRDTTIKCFNVNIPLIGEFNKQFDIVNPLLYGKELKIITVNKMNELVIK